VSEDALRAKLERERHKVALLEDMLEEHRRTAFIAGEKTRRVAALLTDVFRALPSAVLLVGDGDLIVDNNDAAAALCGAPAQGLVGMTLPALFAPGQAPDLTALILEGVASAGAEREVRLGDGAALPAWVTASRIDHDAIIRFVVTLLDLRPRKRLEIELRQAQKLEAVGRLAAGVAHEINTPVQYATDSVQIARDGLAELLPALAAAHEVCAALATREPAAAAVLARADADDLPYLVEALPAALERAREGLGRVGEIVRSMKAFAHPDQPAPVFADVNEAIRNTLLVARHEYRYVADVELDLGELPPVRCLVGGLGQAVLNLVVNAAHAIADVVAGTAARGTITISTRHVDAEVVVAVADTGTGIPAALRERIFEPFFTTKEVGRGTGQGLSLVRGVIVERHHGRIELDSELGRGATFRLYLPVDAAARQEAA
jgi:PAS domain S-box-containing protein